MEPKNDDKTFRQHRVYMYFTLVNGWHCQFLQADLKTPLPRRLTFATADKIRELVNRTGGPLQLEDLQSLEYALEIGRGGIWLKVSPQQYELLLHP